MACGCNNNCDCSNEITIPTGTAGRDGLFGGWSQEYSFDTGTAVNPPTSKIRLNNATPASVTEIYINDTNIDGVDTDAFLDAFANSNNYGIIKLFKEFDSTKFWMGNITNVTDNGTYHTITVTHVQSNSTFAADDNIVVSFTANGNTDIPYYVRTYAQLEALISSSSLIPGATYVLSDYQTEHQVPATSLLNITTAGYVPKIEQLKLVAKSTTEFYHEAESLSHPEDDILYNFTLNTVLSQPRPGLIYWRKDNTNNVEAWFDIRNHTVARYTLDVSGIAWSSNPVDRGTIVTSGGEIYQSIRDGSAVSNFRLVDNISEINQNLYSNNNYICFGNNIPYDASSISFHPAIGNLVTNVVIGKDTTDVLIDIGTDIKIGNFCGSISMITSSYVNIKAGTIQTILVASNYTDIGQSCNQIYLFTSTRTQIEDASNKILIKNSTDNRIHTNVTNILLHDSDETVIEEGSNSLMIIRESNNNKFGSNCAGISLGNSDTNIFDQSCSDIQIYSGGHNRFAQGCSVINLLGEKDDAYTGGTYYSPYSQMLHNTFGTGCQNITFDILGGRGNTFGDECKNLVFTSSGQNWRLVGTNWCRGIQNKTFQHIIHGCSFIVPNQISATITATKWYAQAIGINTDTYYSPSYILELPETGVANSTAYNFTITTVPPSGTAAVTHNATFTSSGSATKANITAGVAAAINSGSVLTATILGDKIHVKCTSTVGLNTSPMPIMITQNIVSPANHFVITKTGEGSSQTNRLFIAEHSFYRNNFIDVSYSHEGMTSDSGFGSVSGNMQLNVDGQLPSYSDLTLRQDPVGCIVQGNAFMWTNAGYPLSVTLQTKIVSPTDPTAGLNRP